ncbi:twin-arginine translocation signal domain-containing protein [Mycolicibacterium gilvum]|uniref:twin-arginine translocation signal domain-containing protein n=1 Tax=Mycolicibacterium gilvum TaxID=1804 RepID=UPI0040459E96
MRSSASYERVAQLTTPVHHPTTDRVTKSWQQASEKLDYVGCVHRWTGLGGGGNNTSAISRRDFVRAAAVATAACGVATTNANAAPNTQTTDSAVSAIDFGADPSGAVSSTAAFHAAFRAAVTAKRSLHTPAGEYLFDTQLVIPGGLHWNLHTDAVLVKNFGDKPGNRRANCLIRNAHAPLPHLLTANPGGWSPDVFDEDISITGGRIRPANSSCVGGGIYLVGVRRLRLSQTVVERSLGDWAITIGGDDIVIDRPCVEDNQELYEDALHLMQGHRIFILEPSLVGGDDAIAFGTNYNLELTDVEVYGGNIKSIRGNALSFYQNRDGITTDLPAPTKKLSNIRIEGLTARSGILRNGIINAAYGIDYTTGTAQAGDITEITLDLEASDEDDFYNDCRIDIIEGTGQSQRSVITNYDGANRRATVSPPFPVATDETSVYSIAGALLQNVEIVNCKFYGGDISEHSGVNPHGARFVNAMNLTFTNVTIHNAIEDALYFKDIQGTLTLERVTAGNPQDTSPRFHSLQLTSCENVQLKEGQYTRTPGDVVDIKDTRVRAESVLFLGIGDHFSGLRTTNSEASTTHVDIIASRFVRAPSATSSRPLSNDGSGVYYTLTDCDLTECDLMPLDKVPPASGLVE